MNKLIAFIDLFKNEKGYTMAFDFNETRVSTNTLPPEMTLDFVKENFRPRTSEKGVKYLASKRPLVIECGNVRKGVKQFFVNVASVTVQPPVDTTGFDDLFVTEETPVEAKPADENF